MFYPMLEDSNLKKNFKFAKIKAKLKNSLKLVNNIYNCLLVMVYAFLIIFKIGIY